MNHLQETYQAKNGGGANGEELNISVPVGTLIKNSKGGIIADLDSDQNRFLLARGGVGGFGNSVFATVEHTTPRFAFDGTEGEDTTVEFELRSYSDVGLVGLPNAGKSSLINILTNQQSDVSSLPGTTLVPHIGRLVYNDAETISIADLPGIEPVNVPFYFNTSKRAGQFLQHCSRSKSLIYLIDGDPSVPLTPSEQFRIIRNHLKEYDFEIERELREIQLSRTQFSDRFSDWSITSNQSESINHNINNLPFIVIITKSDLNSKNKKEIEKLKKIILNFKENNLYYKQLIECSSVDYSGWSNLIFLIRHMIEDISGVQTNQLYW